MKYTYCKRNRNILDASDRCLLWYPHTSKRLSNGSREPILWNIRSVSIRYLSCIFPQVNTSRGVRLDVIFPVPVMFLKL